MAENLLKNGGRQGQKNPLFPAGLRLESFFWCQDNIPNLGKDSKMYERNISNIEELVQKQNEWRMKTLNLIASENVLSNRARRVMGSDFAHRYAEGHPGERYYQGTEVIDEIEARVKKNLKSLFRCKHVDVRPISGTMANDAVFSRYICPGDVVMVNSTPGGGHISHHRAGSVGKYTHNIVNFPHDR